MISIQEANKLIREHTEPIGKKVNMPIADALGFSLAQDVISPIDMPPFSQSAMDGFAVAMNDTNIYTLIDQVKAGDSHEPTLKKGEAIRIYTGAAVPKTADAVVIVEKTEVNGNQLKVLYDFKAGANIRPKGLGITHVDVFKKPSIAILTTGNELVPPGQPLLYGQVYESNSVMLQTAVQQTGFGKPQLFRVKDDAEATRSILKELIDDYDFVGQSLQQLRVKEIFYKVYQKPGKPLYFGTYNQAYIFALPGNPSSALINFYLYVLPALKRFSGYKSYKNKTLKGESINGITKKNKRPQFLKAYYNDNKVEILDEQSSAMLRASAISNALVYAEGNISHRDEVEVILLPNVINL